MNFYINQRFRHLAATAALLVLSVNVAPAQSEGIAFATADGKIEISIADKPFATYVYNDDKILRPYFANVHSPSGVQVTRNHPPVEGSDATDHATMHPGIWLAFGDINGEDFWRNKGRVVHDGFMKEPASSPNGAQFTVRNNYIAPSDKLICVEECTYSIVITPEGYLLIINSKFSSDEELKFGNQEEMGLGVRVATPISARSGGRILNNHGHLNEAQVWGQKASWCDYSGTLDGRPAGALLMYLQGSAYAENWFHARDYGLMVANSFRIPTLTGRMPVYVTVRPGETLNLSYAVLIHDELTGERAESIYNRLGLSNRRIP